MIRPILKKYGLTTAIISLTVISILVSLLITFGLNFLLYRQAPGYSGILIALLVPAIIAPIFSYITLRMLLELIQTQEKLHTLSITDDLTQAFNRRHFYAQALSELNRQKRYGGQTSILLFDVDNFKEVNDNHGHLAGDDILSKISRLTQSQLRDTDVLALFGGDEFILLLPQTDHQGLLSFAERLRQVVAQADFPHDGHHHSVTISIGVATITDPQIDLNQAIKSADQALYRAKHAGGDRVVQAA